MGRYERAPICQGMTDARYHHTFESQSGVDMCVECGWRSDGLVDTGEDVAERRTATSPLSGPERRDAATASVELTTDPDWRHAADSAVREAASNGPTVTSDDVWKILDDRNVAPPHEPRALGPVMKHAVRLGIISTGDGEFVVSKRPENHARPVRVYSSHLYVEPIETINIFEYEGAGE